MVDRLGTLVGDTFEYVDADGVRWPIDTETGAVAPFSLSTYYPSAGCVGTKYVSTFLPRQAATISGEDGGAYVRPDDVQSVPMQVYTGQPGTCSTTASGPYRAIPAGALRAVTRPTVSFTPPLHHETR